MFRKITIVLCVIFIVSCTPAASTVEPPIDFIPPNNYSPTIFDVKVESPASQQRLNDPRPNIIFILTDDQPYWTVDYMPTVKNELIKNGIKFNNGFVTTPLCCPSRVSILTGEYVHNHKVYTDRMPMGGATKMDDTSTVATWLHDAGYVTAYFGKYLNEYNKITPYGVVPPGWDEWYVFLGKNIDTSEDSGSLQYYFNFSLSENGSAIEYPKNKMNFSADVMTAKAVEFINQSRNKPFVLFLAYYNPHSPYIAAPRHKDAFRSGWDWVPYRPPDFNEKDIRDKPRYLEDLSPLSADEIDVAQRQILRSLLSVDDGVASTLNVLKKTGLQDKTIVFYFSDNGSTLGNHRFGVAKNCPYEACVKVPFIVYAPALYPARNDDHLVANIDLAPTFADLAGAAISGTVDGTSLVPLLKDPDVPWREEILFEHWPTEEGVGSIIPEFYAVRTREWKYVEYMTGEKELYDLINDPYELTNLAGKWNYREMQSKLAVKLQELKKQ